MCLFEIRRIFLRILINVGCYSLRIIDSTYVQLHCVWNNNSLIYLQNCQHLQPLIPFPVVLKCIKNTKAHKINCVKSLKCHRILCTWIPISSIHVSSNSNFIHTSYSVYMGSNFIHTRLLKNNECYLTSPNLPRSYTYTHAAISCNVHVCATMLFVHIAYGNHC